MGQNNMNYDSTTCICFLFKVLLEVMLKYIEMPLHNTKQGTQQCNSLALNTSSPEAVTQFSNGLYNLDSNLHSYYVTI